MVANILRFISLAILFLATPINALSLDSSSAQIARHQVIARNIHQSPETLAKRSGRCKPRPTTITHTSSTPLPQSSSHSPAAPSPSPSSAPPTNQGSAGTGKVGIAWALGDDSALGKLKTDKVAAVYTWSPWAPPNTFGMEFVPMLWGKNQIQDFTKLVVQGYAKHVLAFNEPNLDTQSGMSPSDAAALWQAHIEPLKNQGYELITPATASSSNSKSWMQEFINTCKGCTFHKLALHWYGTDAKAFIAYVTDFHNTFHLDIWVTEYTCWDFAGGKEPNAAEALSFMQEVNDWMDNTSWVEKYFTFGFMKNMVGGVGNVDQLMNQDGSPTPLGWAILT